MNKSSSNERVNNTTVLLYFLWFYLIIEYKRAVLSLLIAKDTYDVMQLQEVGVSEIFYGTRVEEEDNVIKEEVS